MNFVRLFISFSITISCIVFMALKIDFDNTWLVLNSFKLQYILPCIAILTIGYILRIFRWLIILKGKSRNITFLKCVAPFLAAIAINNLIPLRLGDVLRSLVFCSSMGISRLISIGSLIIEKSLDILVLFLIAGISLIYLNNDNHIYSINMMNWIGYLLLSGFLLFFILRKFFKHKTCAYINSFIKSRIKILPYKIIRKTKFFLLCIFQMTKNYTLAIAGSVSILIWLCEGVIFYLVLIGLGLESNFLLALMSMTAATFATLVPSSPGYIGPFHFAAFTVATANGIHEDLAISFAVISHLIIWTPTTVYGITCICFNPELWIIAKLKKSLFFKG